MSGFIYKVVDTEGNVIDDAWHWPAVTNSAGPKIGSTVTVAGSKWRVVTWEASFDSGVGELIVDPVAPDEVDPYESIIVEEED